MTRAGTSSPPKNRTSTLFAFSTTWALVTMRPCGVTMKPDPVTSPSSVVTFTMTTDSWTASRTALMLMPSMRLPNGEPGSISSPVSSRAQYSATTVGSSAG